MGDAICFDLAVGDGFFIPTKVQLFYVSHRPVGRQLICLTEDGLLNCNIKRFTMFERLSFSNARQPLMEK